MVACPKDDAMFSDAVKTTNNEDRLKVVDIVELFAEVTELGMESMVGSVEGS